MTDSATRAQLALATLGAVVALGAGFVPAAVALLGEGGSAAPPATPAAVPAPVTTSLDPTTTPRQASDGNGRGGGKSR
jgi:hypothetical protein